MANTVGVRVIEFLREKGPLREVPYQLREQWGRELDALLGYPDSKIPFDEVVEKVAALAAPAKTEQAQFDFDEWFQASEWGNESATLEMVRCARAAAAAALASRPTEPRPSEGLRAGECWTVSTDGKVPLSDCNCNDPVICPVHSKLCARCKHFIPAKECYHSDAEHKVFYHEVCSYQNTIEKLTAEIAELRAASQRESGKLSAKGIYPPIKALGFWGCLWRRLLFWRWKEPSPGMFFRR